MAIRWVQYHKAIDLQKMGCRLTGKRKSENGVDYLEVDVNVTWRSVEMERKEQLAPDRIGRGEEEKENESRG